MTRTQQYLRLAQAALRRGDRASAMIYARQAREAQPMRYDAPADGGRFVGDHDDVEFSPAPSRPPAQQQSRYARHVPTESIPAAKLEAAMRLLLGAETDEELEQARRQVEMIRAMSDDEVRALA
jgi:hypothetical protein